MITPAQCRMGRAALNWTARDLADEAKVGINTVTRFEAGAEALMSTAEKRQRALEKAGVDLIAEDGGGPGVRLRKRKR